VRWSNGTELTRIMPVLRGKDGRGLVVGSLAWTTESQPPQPFDRQVTFDLRNSFGHILAQQPIQVLRWDDPETQPIELAWVLGDQIAVETRRVPKTVASARPHSRSCSGGRAQVIWPVSPPPSQPRMKCYAILAAQRTGGRVSRCAV
jgi:hypothetical protein